MEQPCTGQRWMSLSEPELGLGEVTDVSADAVSVHFPAVDELRRYALASAPLRRVVIKIGDVAALHDGSSLVVESISKQGHLLCYHGNDRSVLESELADGMSFSTPEARWRAGIVDETAVFSLRLEAWYRSHQMRQSPVRGFVGARVDLIPHQFHVATSVAERLSPRALLADEVGLGKTVEAGLILHRLHLTGRAERVLILLPEPLIHQWFVEMLRKFNLSFSIYDEARCEMEEERNPFLESTLILCAVDFLAHSPERLHQAMEAGWDLLIVDEAHHLSWNDGQPGPEYSAVAALAERVPGLLLLTATPQQLGEAGHFARLRLLDPERYADLEQFHSEMDDFSRVAKAVERLQSGQKLTPQEARRFSNASEYLRGLISAGESGREALIAALLDGYGMGRVMFRHTRAQIPGFPVRKVHLAPLTDDEGETALTLKINWLAALLRKLAEAKVLLICASRPLAEDIFHGLAAVMRVDAGLFHEGLSLIQRDRAAAYFAEPEGARLLICSEIGSEGRNFQFAHHLVLFDLPESPELLEQRIGRLDRIGQTSTIHIHVPYLAGGGEEVWARWYHQGLDAFEHTLPAAAQLRELLDPGQVSFAELPPFLKASRKLRDRLCRELEAGQDRLLALNAGRPEATEEMITAIRKLEADGHFETFFLRILAHYGMHIEPLGPRTYVLHPGHLQTAAFPAMPADGLTVTFDRSQALVREDWGFLTWDHPLVRGALDLLLTSEQGNTALAIWQGSGETGFLLETCFVAECIAPAHLQVDRFLAHRPIRIVVDQDLVDLTKDRKVIQASLTNATPLQIQACVTAFAPLLPPMLEKCHSLAEGQMQRAARTALEKAQATFKREISRLHDLHLRHTSPGEPQQVAAIASQATAIESAIRGVRLRLDAMRVILRRAPFPGT